METDGFAALSVNGLVAEIGTTRPAFYRRFGSVGLLAFEVIQKRFGGGAAVDTGSLESDLLKLQRDDVAMMTSALIQRNLPGLLQVIQTDELIRGMYLDKFITPRRTNVERVLSSARERGERIKKDADSEYICDLLFGPILSRVLLPMGLAINDELARMTVQTVMRELTP